LFFETISILNAYVRIDREFNPRAWIRTHRGILLITLGGLVTELFGAAANRRTFANVRSKRKDIKETPSAAGLQAFRDGRCAVTLRHDIPSVRKHCHLKPQLFGGVDSDLTRFPCMKLGSFSTS
jgi:hypothetical protein